MSFFNLRKLLFRRRRLKTVVSSPDGCHKLSDDDKADEGGGGRPKNVAKVTSNQDCRSIATDFTDDASMDNLHIVIGDGCTIIKQKKVRNRIF